MAIQIGVFLAIGIVLSLGGVIGNLLINRNFRFPLDVQYELNLPVLALIGDYSPLPVRKSLIRRKGKKSAQVKTKKVNPEIPAEESQPIPLSEGVVEIAPQEINTESEIRAS